MCIRMGPIQVRDLYVVHIKYAIMMSFQDAMMSLNEELKSSQGTIVGLKSSVKEVGVVSMWVNTICIGMY